MIEIAAGPSILGDMRSPLVFLVLLVALGCERHEAPTSSRAEAEAGKDETRSSGTPFTRSIDDGSRTRVGDYEVMPGSTELTEGGAAVVSTSCWITPRFAAAGGLDLERIEVVNDDDSVRPLRVQRVLQEPDNGGGPVTGVGGRYHLSRFQDSVLTPVEIEHEPVRAPARALRLTLSGTLIDLPLRFGPATDAEIPPSQRPGYGDTPCGKLDACCAKHTRPDLRDACQRIVEDGSRLGEQEFCERAARDYCR